MEDRELCVALNDREINAKAEELSQLMAEFDQVKEEKRAATKEFSQQLKDLRARMKTVSKVIREKQELRLIACEVRFHSPVVGTKQTVRLDTNEVIEQEEMSMSERQQNVFTEHQEWEKLFKAEEPGLGDSSATV